MPNKLMKFIGEANATQLLKNIKKELEKKVSKVEGKGLSTNDYTTAEKEKLAGIAAGATKVTSPADIDAAQIVATYITSSNNPDFDLDTATDSLYLIPSTFSKGCPVNTSFIYIRQVFYGSISSTANRTQIAYPYASSTANIPTNCLAIRACNGGVWSEWKQFADTDYAVNKAGDTMAGDLNIKKDGGITTGLNPEATGLQIRAYSEWGKRNFLWIPSELSAAPYNELQYVVVDSTNGKNGRFNILHTGNKNLIDPDDIGALDIASSGTLIPSGANLDEYLTPGVYRSTASTVSASLTNPPWTNAGFKMIVMKHYTTSGMMQLALPHGSSAPMKFRYYEGTTWTGWRTFYDSSNKPTPADIGALKQGSYERIQGTADVHNDLNNYTQAGFYNVKTAYVDNCPTGIGIDAVLLVYPWNDLRYPLQEITESAASETSRRWIRHCNNGTWGAWKAVISEDNKSLITPSDINAIGVYSRANMGTSFNFDDPGINGLFEVRRAETPNATGTQPFMNYGPILSLKTPDNLAMLQLAGKPGNFYIRAKQGANVTLADVPWTEILHANNGIALNQDCRTRIDKNTDLNTLTAIGNYCISSSADAVALPNIPDGLTKAFRMIVGNCGASSAYIFQEITEYSNGDKWYRYSANSGTTWQPWVQTITSKNIGSQSVAKATKATQDASGNVITSTYATKTELNNKVSTMNVLATAAVV